MHEATAAAAAVSPTIYWLAAAIFGLSYALIMSEKVDKVKVALLGGGLTIGLSILTQHDAFHSTVYGIDYNVIFLLISMMIMVNIMGESGIFEWMAIVFAKLGKGQPVRILMIFVVFTAISSAFLDNVTTVILLAPVTLLIADELEIDPIPFLLAEAMASNIGGTATLIGDPPNLLIASKAQLGFTDFLVHLAPIVILMMVVFVGSLYVIFKKRMTVSEDARRRVMNMDESRLIKDPALARKSVIVLILTMIGFTVHGMLHLELKNHRPDRRLGPALHLRQGPTSYLCPRRMDHHLFLYRSLHHRRWGSQSGPRQ